MICGIIIKSSTQQPVIWASTPNLGWPSVFPPADITPSTGCSARSVYFIPHRSSDTFLWRRSMTGHSRTARLSGPSLSSKPPTSSLAPCLRMCRLHNAPFIYLDALHTSADPSAHENKSAVTIGGFSRSTFSSNIYMTRWLKLMYENKSAQHFFFIIILKKSFM